MNELENVDVQLKVNLSLAQILCGIDQSQTYRLGDMLHARNLRLEDFQLV